jgi:hypothetical protein
MGGGVPLYLRAVRSRAPAPVGSRGGPLGVGSPRTGAAAWFAAGLRSARVRASTCAPSPIRY